VSSIQKALYALHRRQVSVPRRDRITEAFVDLGGACSSLLDVGAGDGEIASHVAARLGASRVAGVDVLVRPESAIEVVPYDGEKLPFPDRSFDVVTISDVLHHCQKPTDVLRECLRVANRCVLVKDHFRFGPLSRAVLLAMDVVGNQEAGVFVRGTYFSPAEWIDMVRDAGGTFAKLVWPMRIHDAPFRYVTRDEVQFAARIERIASEKEMG
jgi:ubiquinone/menaquinone biosynthesis C-methylase UbiE